MKSFTANGRHHDSFYLDTTGADLAGNNNVFAQKYQQKLCNDAHETIA